MQKNAVTTPENRHAIPDDNFPLAPDGVKDAYGSYWQTTHTPATIGERTQRDLSVTNGYISDFCNTTVPPEVYTAATLSPLIIDEKNPMFSMNARRGLNTFQQTYLQSGATLESLRYIYGIATDEPVINDFWQGLIPELYEKDEKRLELLLDKDGTAEVPKELWTNQRLGMSALGILELREVYGANIESLLVGGASSAQHLFSPNVANDAKTLQEVVKARSLWAPYGEFIGYDGLAMLLQSRSHELQFLFQGNQEALKQAYDIIYSMGDPATVEFRVQQMLQAMFGDHIQERVLGDMMSHGIVIGEALTNDSNTRIVWRRKSLGSLARKIAQILSTLPAIDIKDMPLPMDIVGSTAIKEDATEIGIELREVLERARANKSVRLTPPPSRIKENKALHVQGAEQYIDDIRRAMGYADWDAMDKDFNIVPDTPYQVAKITYKYQQWGDPLPLHSELQFNTRADRLEARIGSCAHASLKLTGVKGGVPEDRIKLMEGLYQDRLHIGDMRLSPQSGVRSDDLMRKVARVSMY